MRLLVLAALVAATVACDRASMPSLSFSDTDKADAAVPAGDDFAYAEADVASLQARMSRGELSSRALTQAYLDRIAAIDDAGPKLNAVIETNLNSMFNVTKQVVGDMVEKGWGRIINISSVNGEKGQAGQTNYSAAKAGMHGFSMALAQELATKGVTVNTVSPGYIGTDMVNAIRPDVLEKIVATVPVKRLGKPSEIASIIAWLASEDGGYTTGADFAVNGGLHMG